jgi:hypothetical protein
MNNLRLVPPAPLPGRAGADPGPTRASAVDESSALVLALVAAANGRVDERELEALDRLDAFGRLGVTRHRFVELTRACIETLGVGWRKQLWLRPAQTAYMDTLLDEVGGSADRLLVCRLAAAVLLADGRATHDERIVYDRMLSRWQISQMTVCRTIVNDGTRSRVRPATSRLTTTNGGEG